MKDDVAKILEIVTGEQALNASRYTELKGLFTHEQDLNAKRYTEFKDSHSELRDSYSELKGSIEEITKIVIQEQELNARRYIELKGSVDGIHTKMTTKEDLNRVFNSLSQDICALVADHSKLKKRVDSHDRRLRKLETARG